VAILALVWLTLIRPAGAERDRIARESEGLRARLTAAERSLDPAVPGTGTEDPRLLFERQIDAGASTSQLLGALTRLAMTIGARDLVIDSNGMRVAVGASGTGPRASDAAEPDPRMALFELPLAYSTVPLSFEASYEAVGEFLWRFRNMPAAIEIRRLEITSRAEVDREDSAETRAPVADGTVAVSMTLFVYARQDASPVVPASTAGAR
jgi:hypothetical protein